MLSLGLDIGGANAKAILLRDGKVKRHWLEYIPLWKEKEKLGDFLGRLAGTARPDVVGATLTGELCDVFENRSEGVLELVDVICNAFGEDRCLFMSLSGGLFTRDRSITSPLELAAANWIASAWVVGREHSNCVLMDVGSTTTDIIPVRRGGPASPGRGDFQRLRSGELVYTGALRTPLPFVCSEVELGRERMGVAAESFAIMADVYRVLGEIEERDYACETPDGRGKDGGSCMRRIARTFCGDPEELGRDFIVKAAETFRDKQVASVAEALGRVANSHGLPKTVEVVVTGLGRNILAGRAARASGFRRIVDLVEVYGEEAALMTPAFSVGVLAAEVPGWTR